ncbi:hypothetical protein SAMN05661010_00304 [Modicisalibacter muralis]|uniref:Uncharacterized protein n=1 Tax=Modicisalibacter muralis TaxID=119000 RepID=A0A1G9F9Z8_9GAMM|nr:hypothetical protein [Halomonas muralis]SDK85171.1 hypothetical protein SAMN05661010_00304 [Halomonas muralis]
MEQIKFALAIVGTFFGVLGLALLAIACIVALFKIGEADRYYGVGTMGWGRSQLTFPPWSIWRMTEYGMIILFARTRYVQRRWGDDLELVKANTPPKWLERLLVWLYASWFLLVIAGFALGSLMMLLPEAR